MGRFESLVGKRVEVRYRAGDIQLSASGMLVSDTGKSIFIEEHFSQGGRGKTLRLEIPYEYLKDVAELKAEDEDPYPPNLS